MKIKFIFLCVFSFFFSNSINSQEWSDWSGVTTNSCLNQSLQHKVLIEEFPHKNNNNHNYKLFIRFKNDFSQRIHFTIVVSENGKEKPGERVSLGSGKSSFIANWFLLATKNPKYRIEKVRFGERDTSPNWTCNEVNKTYYSN